jgi:two-component system, OmpR family, sensor kinase
MRFNERSLSNDFCTPFTAAPFAGYETMGLTNEPGTLQRELARRNVEPARLTHAENHLLGMAARQLRGPIGNIRSCSENLMNNAASTLTAEQRDFVQIICDSSDSMLRLINDLLDISKIEAGELSLDPSTTDLVELVKHILGPHAVIAEHKHIRLEFTHDEMIPEMSIDGPKMEQVLNNLISNAIKFSHPNTVTCVSLTLADEGVYLRVKDQGQGIPAHEVETLFKPFQRTSVRSTGGETSTGLGLAIVNRIVQGHGGVITVTSEVGSGTEFTVLLPAALVAGRHTVRYAHRRNEVLTPR